MHCWARIRPRHAGSREPSKPETPNRPPNSSNCCSADAEYTLRAKPRKNALDDQRIATDRIAWAKGKLADLRRVLPEGCDHRIFPRVHVPVMVMEQGGRVIKYDAPPVPSRWQARVPRDEASKQLQRTSCQPRKLLERPVRPYPWRHRLRCVLREREPAKVEGRAPARHRRKRGVGVQTATALWHVDLLFLFALEKR
jgi:hypothetical protein